MYMYLHTMGGIKNNSWKVLNILQRQKKKIYILNIY